MTTVAEVREQLVKDLRASADVIEKNGWVQGQLFAETEGLEPPECPVCSYGAILTAVEGDPVGSGRGEWAVIQRTIGARGAMNKYVRDNVIAWNDRAGRTAEEVIQAFRACADEIEAGGDFQ